MSLFIETIKIRYGKLYNMAYHNARANATRREVLNIAAPLDLAHHISIPLNIGRGVYKCRILYGRDVVDVRIERYLRKRIKTVRLVTGNDIDYKYKFADRTDIDRLFAQRGHCDDILIVRDGLITDTSYANVAFFDGTRWMTPATPLLRGTKRQELIEKGTLHETDIKPADLHRFSAFTIFNAMVDFNRHRAIPVAGIVTFE